MPLDIESRRRGEWNVVTRPGGVRVTPYSLPNRKAAKAALKAIADGVTGFDWDVVGRDPLRAAMQVYLDTHERSMTDTVLRSLAAEPAADPHGWCAQAVRQRDEGLAAAAAYKAAEEADGYTEVVEHTDVAVGDEISFRYPQIRARHGLPPLERGRTRSLIVRGTVTGPFRWMDRHGNNYYEGRTGPRFPLADAVWLDRADGTTGPVTAPVTVDVLSGIRRRPRTA